MFGGTYLIGLDMAIGSILGGRNIVTLILGAPAIRKCRQAAVSDVGNES